MEKKFVIFFSCLIYFFEGGREGAKLNLKKKQIPICREQFTKHYLQIALRWCRFLWRKLFFCTMDMKKHYISRLFGKINLRNFTLFSVDQLLGIVTFPHLHN